MERHMDTKHLEYFRIVYEEKSIHAAAKKLFISPQGLGRISFSRWRSCFALWKPIRRSG